MPCEKKRRSKPCIILLPCKSQTNQIYFELKFKISGEGNPISHTPAARAITWTLMGSGRRRRDRAAMGGTEGLNAGHGGWGQAATRGGGRGWKPESVCGELAFLKNNSTLTRICSLAIGGITLSPRIRVIINHNHNHHQS